jgi:hypothetical protein
MCEQYFEINNSVMFNHVERGTCRETQLHSQALIRSPSYSTVNTHLLACFDYQV